jgi:hypothetical protein
MALLKANTGIGTINPLAALHVIGDGLFVGIVSATAFYGNLVGTADRASNLVGGVQGSIPYQSGINSTTLLSPGSAGQVLVTNGAGQNPYWAPPSAISGGLNGITIRDEGSIVGTALSVSSINFVGPNVVATASGTASTITFSNDAQYLTGTAPGSVISQSSGLSITGDLFVSGNVSVGGSSVILDAATLQIKDKNIVLGITTNTLNQDISSDLTASHGGISIASTEGSPLINFPLEVGINSSPYTYKQFIWIKEGTYSGMGTDAWVTNYALSVGNTSTVANGSRLTVGAGFTVYDDQLYVSNILSNNVVINGISTLGTVQISSGIVTASTGIVTYYGDGSKLSGVSAVVANYANTSGFSTFSGYSNTSGIATYANAAGVSTFSGYSNVSGIATYANISGIATYANISGIATYANVSGIATYSNTAGIATYANTAGIATYADTSGFSTFSGYSNVSGIATYSNISGFSTFSGYSNTSGVSTFSEYSNVSGIATYADVAGIATNVIGGIASITQLQVSGISTFTNGPVLVGTSNSTGTTGQLLQVNGDAYVSGNTGIGTTNPSSKLFIVGDGYFTGVVTATKFSGDGSGLSNVGSALTVSVKYGIGGTNGNEVSNVTAIRFNGPPFNVTNLGNGEVLITSESTFKTWYVAGQPTLVASGDDYVQLIAGPGIAITTRNTASGIGTGEVKSVTFTSTSGVSISTNTTDQAQYLTYVTGTGSTTEFGVNPTGLLYNPFTSTLGINTTSFTGTASQRLQVTGGAYVSGNLGIGTTNPQYKLDVNGDAKISDIKITGTQIIGNGTGILGNIQLIPDENLTGQGQYVKLRPTASLDQSHIHIEAGDVNNADLYLGDDDRFVKIDHNGPVVIGVPAPATTSNWTATSDNGPTSFIVINTDTYPWAKYITIGDTVTLPDTTVVNISNNSLSNNLMYVYLESAISYLTGDILVFSYRPRTEWKFNPDSSAIFPGYVGIGTTNPISKLHVVGNVYITGVTTSTDFDSLSDLSLKTNVNTIPDPLEKVMQIRGVTFDWKETQRSSAGVIAQEIEKVLPELVHGEETKTVNYNGLIGLLIECVKKQQEEIDELKKRL